MRLRTRTTVPDDRLDPRRRPGRSTAWAAAGAAIAVAVGGLLPSAAPAASANTTPVGAFVPITPCRLIDTRPGTTVGVNPGTIDGEDTFVFQVVGSTDPCPATIPADAISIVTNVTAVGPTAPTFLTLWGDGDRPTTSNLNPVPGSPPTPNAVTITLGGSGEFRIFNRAGSVDVIVDVMGYHVDHDHDDRYYTEAEADARFARTGDVYTRVQADGRFVQPAEVYTRTEADARFESSTAAIPIAASESGGNCFADGTRVGGLRDGVYDTCVILTTGMADEHVLHITASASWFGRDPSVSGVCELRRNGTSTLPNSAVGFGDDAAATDINQPHQLAVNTVTGPYTGTATYELACRELDNDVDITSARLSVIVLPT